MLIRWKKIFQISFMAAFCNVIALHFGSKGKSQSFTVGNAHWDIRSGLKRLTKAGVNAGPGRESRLRALATAPLLVPRSAFGVETGVGREVRAINRSLTSEVQVQIEAQAFLF